MTENIRVCCFYRKSFDKKQPGQVEKYILENEEAIRKAIETAEIAKQKEIEARKAKEEAVKVNQKLLP